MHEEQVKKQEPYQALAEIYDYVMRHVNYAEWAAYIHSILQRLEYHPRQMVDLACGTGNTTLELHRLQYAITGVDSSATMIQVARQKAVPSGIPFLQGDMRQLAGLGPFDAAVCLYDSFNYLLTPADVSQALAEIHCILSPASLFIFDVCTQQNSLHYFRDTWDEDQGPTFFYRRHSYYDPQQQLQFNHFVIQFDGQGIQFEENHVQRIYALEDLITQIHASPLKLLEAFDGFTFDPGSERSDRVHFVLCRPA